MHKNDRCKILTSLIIWLLESITLKILVVRYDLYQEPTNQSLALTSLPHWDRKTAHCPWKRCVDPWIVITFDLGAKRLRGNTDNYHHRWCKPDFNLYRQNNRMSICYEGYMTHKLSSPFHWISQKNVIIKFTYNLCSKWCFFYSITIKVLNIAINFCSRTSFESWFSRPKSYRA